MRILRSIVAAGTALVTQAKLLVRPETPGRKASQDSSSSRLNGFNGESAEGLDSVSDGSLNSCYVRLFFVALREPLARTCHRCRREKSWPLSDFR